MKSQPIDKLREKIEKLLPRMHCPSTCDGYGTYAEADSDGDPTPVQCRWCYEVVMPLRVGIKALVEAEIVEALKIPNDLLRSAHSIALRKGRVTNWGAFEKKVRDELNREHRLKGEALKQPNQEEGRDG